MPVFATAFGGMDVNIARPRAAKSGGQNGRLNVAENVAYQLTERQRIIYDFIKQNVAVNVAVNTKSISEELGVNRKTIQRELIALKEAGIVQWVGSDKKGYWVII